MYKQLDGAAADDDAEIKKLRERFGAFKKEAELSEVLVTLERHAPIGIPPIEELAPTGGTDAAAKYFEKLGFATLLKRLLFPTADEKPAPKPKKIPPAPQASLF
jgi:hypothetical protein